MEEKGGGIKSGVRMPVLTPLLKRRGRGVFWASTVVLLVNMVIFGALTVELGKIWWYLGESTVVFGHKYKGGRRKGGIKSGVRTPVLTPHLKRWGRWVFWAYTVVLWANMVIFGEIAVVFRENMVVFGRNYCGIWS